MLLLIHCDSFGPVHVVKLSDCYNLSFDSVDNDIEMYIIFAGSKCFGKLIDIANMFCFIGFQCFR